MSDGITISIVESAPSNITVGLSTTPDIFSIDAYPVGTIWGNITGTLSSQTDLYQALQDAGIQTLFYEESSLTLYISRGNNVSLSSIPFAALSTVLNYFSTTPITISSVVIDGDTFIGGNIFIGGSATIVSDVNILGSTYIDNTFFVNSSATIVGSLSVGENVFFDSNLSVDNSLFVNEDIFAGGTFTADGSANIGDNLNVGGSVDIDGSLTVNTSATIMNLLSVAGDAIIDGTLYTSNTAYVLDTFFETIGDGTTNSFSIQHNLETRDVYVVVRDAVSNLLAFPAIQATTPNSITISFNFIPAPDSYNVSIFAAKPSNRVSAYRIDLTVPERPRANVLYVSVSGDDNNSGSDPDYPLKTIKKACKIAHDNRVLSYNDPSVKYTIFVSTGDYYENNPIYVPPNTSIIGDNLRRASILPLNRQDDILWCDNSVYVWGFTFRNHLDPSAATAFLSLKNPVLTAIALGDLLPSFVRTTFNYDREKCKRDVGFILSGVRVDLLSGNNDQSIINGQAYYTGMNLVLPNAQVTPTIQAIQHAQDITKGYVAINSGTASLTAIDVLFNTVVGIISGGVVPEVTQFETTFNSKTVKGYYCLPLGNPTTSDVILAFHGFLSADSDGMDEAKKLLEQLKDEIGIKSKAIVSVTYPQENVLVGDNIDEAEAALLWLKSNPQDILNTNVGDIYLFGTKLGGYLVSRLNTMHDTAGVISNSPDPINLNLRCQVSELAPPEEKFIECEKIFDQFGTIFTNSQPYSIRSLINYTTGHIAEALYIQGLQDTTFQVDRFNEFEFALNSCTNCAPFSAIKVLSGDENAFIETEEGKQAILNFLNVAPTSYPNITFPVPVDANVAVSVIENNTEIIKNSVITYIDNLYPPIYRWRRPYITTSPYIQGSSSITQALPPLLQRGLNIISQKYNNQTITSAPSSIATANILIDTINGIISEGVNNFSPITFPTPVDFSTAQILLSTYTEYAKDRTVDYITKTIPYLNYNKEICKRDTGFILSAIQLDIENGNNDQSIVNGQAYYLGALSPVLPQDQTVPTINAFNNLKNIISYILNGNYTDRKDISTAFDIITKIMTYGPNSVKSLIYDKEKCKRDVGFILSAVSVDMLSGNNNQAIINGQAYYTGMNLVLPNAQILPTIQAIQHAQNETKKYVTPIIGLNSLSAVDIPFNTIVDIISGGLNNYTNQTFIPPTNILALSAIESIEKNINRIKTSVIGHIDALYSDSARGVYPGALSAASILQQNISFIQKETIAFLDTVYPNLVYDKTKCERDLGYILSAVQVDIVNGNLEEVIRNGREYYNGNNLTIPQAQVLPTIVAINYAKRLAEFITTNRPVKGLLAGSGMRIDGSDAEGFLRSFVLDSYTQFNEGGRGIYVTNNGYAQLVSIFTICCTEGIRADNGGSLSMNNSNCSFGLSGITAVGKSPSPVLTGTLVSDPFRTDQITVTDVYGVDVFPDSDYYPSVLQSPLRLDTRKIAFVPYNGLAFTIGNDPTLYPIRGNPEFIGTELDYNRDLCKRDLGFILSAVREDIQNGNNEQSIINGQAYYTGMNLVIPNAQITPTVDAIRHAQTLTKDYITSSLGSISLTAIDLTFSTIIDIISGGYNNFVNQTFTIPVNVNTISTIIENNTENIKNNVITYIDSIYNKSEYIFTVPENVRTNYTPGEPVRLFIRSVVTTSSHTFEFIGSGILLRNAVPALGGLTVTENEARSEEGGAVFFTSTNQAGDFRVGSEFTIVQETATIEGDTFKRSILTLVTPLTLALE
jgi:hypothetical protein